MREQRFSLRHILGTTLLAVAGAFAQDRGTLQVVTTPDSAYVILDDQKEAERQRTPYVNESMKAIDHTVLLRPADPAYMPVRYDISIGAGQTTQLQHTFEYRTKATGMELLSIAPWKVQFGAGIQYLRYMGMQTKKTLDTSKLKPGDAGAATASATAGVKAASSSYPPDSIPTSMELPLQLRVGFPFGFETHFSYPLANRTEPWVESGAFGLAGVGMGLKWTVPQINSAVDLNWAFGSKKISPMFPISDAFTITLITSQRIKKLDVAGNLGYTIRVNSMDTSNRDTANPTKLMSPGGRIFLSARAGMLFFDQVLPLLQGNLDYDFADVRGSYTSHQEKYLITATPGVVWYATPSAAFEFGIPLGLIASNQETKWGLRASMTWGFSVAGSQVASPSAAKGSGLSVPYPLPSQSAPVNSPSHVLFASREVTNAEYKEFCDKTGHEYPPDPDIPSMPGYFTDPRYSNYPVVSVSIADARAYANSLGKRLPSVSEWRKEVENLRLSGAMVACGTEAPEAVDSRPQGPGMYNLIGNVAEWVENDRAGGSVAYMAGGFFSLPRERCLETGRLVDVASQSGAKYIGFRVATEVK
ncbi:MAG: SUMF1/EgtB/PvdO family nonheme iron enzyme [Fibrobacterota bacterium]|nr:SUMF1/EgtB/PvdO family nonheme iron enzyme [Fibrobacterota bacterium]QQS05698.1 MAG: SUMF1/EgtB/PvdO family nonheme iron enzyme [Fibrobacterota bacterium]